MKFMVVPHLYRHTTLSHEYFFQIIGEIWIQKSVSL